LAAWLEILRPVFIPDRAGETASAARPASQNTLARACALSYDLGHCVTRSGPSHQYLPKIFDPDSRAFDRVGVAAPLRADRSTAGSDATNNQ
jgi:hypothetical protein